VSDSDENAAVPGVTESSIVPTSYEHQTNPNICFWDLPGIGTPNYHDHNISAYYEKVCIEKYDMFLIVSSQRFLNDDLMLAEKVKSMGKSFFFVRTKIDNDKRAEKRRLKTEFNEKEMLERIRNDCAENLKKLNKFNKTEMKIFLISSWKPTKWDFESLKVAILDELPTEQKEALALTMRATSKDMLREKIRSMKGL
jgi:predicted GTPase